MTEGQEVLASHEEVEAFVAKLKRFHSSLDEGERAMMGTILEGAMAGETGGYASGIKFEALAGWLEDQGSEDTQGFAVKCR